MRIFFISRRTLVLLSVVVAVSALLLVLAVLSASESVAAWVDMSMQNGVK